MHSACRLVAPRKKLPVLMRVWVTQTNSRPQMPISWTIDSTTDTSLTPPSPGMVAARKIPARPLSRKATA
ncbi:hypothetical protein D3C86_1897930 [compost metagenome]